MNNNSKDLMALACLAFKQNDFGVASTLFASSMDSGDSPEFVQSLTEGNYTLASLSSVLGGVSTESGRDELSAAAATINLGFESSFTRKTKKALGLTFIPDEDLESDSGSFNDTHNTNLQDLDFGVSNSPIEVI
jgi:hypothetical protein